jgi:hypothetical protein
MFWRSRLRVERISDSAVTQSSRGLEDHDRTVLLGIVLTPLIGFGGTSYPYRVESQGCRVSGVWMGLNDVPGEDAKDDAVVRSRADPA